MKKKKYIIPLFLILLLILIGWWFFNSQVFYVNGKWYTRDDILTAGNVSFIPKDFYQDDEVNVEYDKFNRIFSCSNTKDEASIIMYNRHNKNNYRPGKLIILEESENEKFFQFKTKRENGLLDTHRIIKCSYISNFEYVLNNQVYIATFSQRPITKENTKSLVEFLWYSWERRDTEMSSISILSSSGKESRDYITYNIYYVFTDQQRKLMGRVSSEWDYSALYKSTFKINKKTGKIKNDIPKMIVRIDS